MTTTTLLTTPDPGDEHDRATPAPATLNTSEDTSGELVPVIHAEILTPEQSAAIDARRAATGTSTDVDTSAARPRTAVGRIVRPVVAVARHERTKAAGVATLRASVTTGMGVVSWCSRAWDASTHGVYRRAIRSAEAAGDREALAQWTEAAEYAKQRRHDRMMELPTMAAGLVRVAAGAVVVLFVLLLLVSIVAAAADIASFTSVWAGAFAVVAFVAALVAVLWLPLLCSVPVAVTFAAYREGKRRMSAPRWLTRMVGDEDEAAFIDERAISQALAHLGIPALSAFFKSDGKLTYSVPARVDGDGTYAQLRLPMGVTAAQVADRRDRLAANLHRATLECWPTTGDEAGVLDLWVADKGKLNAGAGDWPLLHEGECDVFAGVPIGRAQRGHVLAPPLFASNWLIGGRPGQGKSAALRTLLLGAALDPTAELWVSVMGESPDFDPFRPRLTRYAMGMDDQVAADTVQALRDLLAEMERRGKVLGRQPGRPPKVSRKLANRAGLGLHPLVFVIDECHELFTHQDKTIRSDAADLAVKLIKRGRKYGIVLLLATQSPTAASIPRDVTRNVSAGIAYSVGDQVANDGLLGTGKHKAGIRATDLRMNTDRGTSVAVGVSDATFELVRWFYVPFEDGADMVSPVVARAVAAMQDRRTTADVTQEPGETVPVVDHLADVATVIGDAKRLRTMEVLSGLAALRPDEYAGWTFTDLSDALAEHDVKVAKSDGVRVVRAADVADAIARRATDDHGDDGDDAAPDDPRDITDGDETGE